MYNPGFFIENNIFWNGMDDCWEKESLKIWKKLAETSSVIFDIGANTGVYALLAKATNPSAKVFAVEPLPRIYHILEKNNGINRFNINCLNCALSDFDGEATFYDVDTVLGDVSSASLAKNFQENQIELKVPVKKLATLIEQLKHLYFDIDDEQGLFQQKHITKSKHFNYLLCTPEKAKALSLV